MYANDTVVIAEIEHYRQNLLDDDTVHNKLLWLESHCSTTEVMIVSKKKYVSQYNIHDNMTFLIK